MLGRPAMDPSLISPSRLGLLFLIAMLSACGGGGGGTSGSGSSSGGGSSAGEPEQLSLSTTTISASADTATGGPLVSYPLQFAVNHPKSDHYYYSISYGGTALTGVSTSGVTGSQASTSNSLIGSAAMLAPAIGGTVTGAMDGAAASINQLIFVHPAVIGAGSYSDTLSIAVCYDAPCSQQVPGSPQSVNISYTVTGDATPITSISAASSLRVEAASSQTTAATASVQIHAANLPPRGAYVFIDASMPGVLSGSSFEPAALHADQAADGTIAVTLNAPSAVGAGIYQGNLAVKVCFDNGCTTQANGSPLSVPISYVVDASAGTDFKLKSLPLTVSSMVWNDVTQKIYALIPSSSAQYPDTLAQIDPASGVVENTVPLVTTPGTLSVSPDGVRLYAAAPGKIYKLRASDLALLSTTTLPANQNALAIKEAPGAPAIVAVRLTTATTPIVKIFKNGTALTDKVASASASILQTFDWGIDKNTLFAHMDAGSSSTVAVAATSNTGASITQTSAPVTSDESFFSGDVLFNNGLLYWDGGAVFDTLALLPAAPLVSTSYLSTVPTSYRLALDATRDRAYFLTDEQPDISGPTPHFQTITGFELSTRKQLWTARFPSQNISGQLIRWGSNGLAFVTSNASDNLLLISGSIVSK